MVLKEGKNREGKRRKREIARTFEHEVEALSTVSHPNIVRILDADLSKPVLVLEYLPGPNLHQFILGGYIGTVTGLKIARKILEALEEFHKKGICHRDVKPKNVVVDRSENEGVIVIDPGHCKFRGRADWAASDGTSFGNPIYRAPECCGSDDVGGDLYSVGAIIYDLSQTRGHVSFVVTRPKIWLLKETDILLTTDLREGRLPREVYNIVRRARSREKVDNFKSATQMISEVDYAIERLGKRAEK